MKYFGVFQALRLCSIGHALKILASQTTCCLFVEICLELIKTDFERAQLKYYNFLRAKNNDLQYDDDDHYYVGYIIK